MVLGGQAGRPGGAVTGAPTTSGGTLFEENVHAAADFVNKTTVDEIVTLIRDAGFTPAQRTTEYEISRPTERRC